MRKTIFAVFAAFVFAGCSTPRAADAPSTIDLRAGPAPQSYMRVARPDTNTVQLQIAVRKFVPADHRGPTVWLAGASHIGEPAYYHALQMHLNAQTTVLYEGVNSAAHTHHAGNRGPVHLRRPPPNPATTNAASGSMQATLASSLGLVFQLDAIDYNRANFLNSDLSIQQIEDLMEGGDTNAPPAAADASGASGDRVGSANRSFDTLLQVMDGSSFLGSLFKLAVQFIGSDPKLQAITKLAFIETIGQMKGDFSEMHGLPPDMRQLLKVLIQARNQNVIDDLKTELKTTPRTGSISIFYGTGHMDDMERRLTRELNYQASGDLWLTAFSVDLRKTGLSQSELQTIQNLVKWELQQMQ